MALLIDINLSFRLATYYQLNEIFGELIHVAQLGLEGADDISIWEYASKNSYHILTKDSDFNKLQYIYGFPPKIIWIRSGNVSTSYVIALLLSEKDPIIKFLGGPDQGILEIF